MITLINGGVQNASNIFVPNGSISFQLNVDATVIAAPGGFVCADIPIVFQFDANGNILPNAPAATAQIWSNAELNPQNVNGLGTYYLVTIYDQAGARLNTVPMWWQFPEATGSTVDISQLTPYATVGGNVIFYPTSFVVPSPGFTTLGGIFANAGLANEFVTAINTDGTVTIRALALADLPAIAAANLTDGTTGTGPIVLAVSPTFTGTVVAAALAPTATLTTVAQATFRLTDSELTISSAVTSIVGSVAAVRGAITQAAGEALASGFMYGVQGKLVLAGTLANGSGFNAAVFGQIDASNAAFVHTSGYLAPIMGDFGATSIMANDANANMIALLNTTNCIIHSALLFAGNASYAFDFTDLAFGGAHFVATQSGLSTLSKSLKVRVNGTDYYIPLCTGTT